MSNSIKEKVHVRSCEEVARYHRDDKECGHIAVGLKYDEVTEQCTESVACPVAVARQLRGSASIPAFSEEPKHMLDFQPILDSQGRPYRCAHFVQRKGSLPHRCGRPSVLSIHLMGEGQFMFDKEYEVIGMYYGACRIHTQTLSGVKVRNREKIVSMPRDFQRSRVYRWQREVFPGKGKATLTLDECRELVERIWAAHAPEKWAVPAVRLDTRKNRRGGSSYRWRTGIKLAPNQLNPIVVIHEMTHALCPVSGDGHGPLFVRLFLELVKRYAGEEAEPAEDLKVASYEELVAYQQGKYPGGTIERLRGFEIAEKAAA